MLFKCALVWGQDAASHVENSSVRSGDAHAKQHVHLRICFATNTYLNPPTSFAISFAAGFPLNAANRCLATKYFAPQKSVVASFHVSCCERKGRLPCDGYFTIGKRPSRSGIKLRTLPTRKCPPEDPGKVHCRVGTGRARR